MDSDRQPNGQAGDGDLSGRWYSAGMFLFVLLCSGLLLSPRLRHDGLAYVSTSRSIVIDGDLNTYNEDAYYTNPGWNDVSRRIAPGKPRTILKYFTRPDFTERGYRFALFPAGNTLFWLPPCFMASLVCSGEADEDGGSCTGYTNGWIGVLTVWNVIWFLIALMVCLRALEAFFSPAISALAIAAVVGTGNILPFIVIDPCFSHSIDFCIHAFCLYLFIRISDRPDASKWLLCGAVIGFAVTVRYQDLFMLVFPAAAMIRSHLQGRTGRSIRLWSLSFCAGFLLFISVQAIYWNVLTGSFWIPPSEFGAADLPSLNPWAPQLLPMLFSRFHGLLTWMPGWGLAIVGLAFFFRRDRWLASAVVIALILHAFYTASRSEWWNLGFSVRRFSGLGICFMLGMAALLDRCRENRVFRITAAILLVILVLWNVMFQGVFYSDRIQDRDADPLNRMIRSSASTARYDYGWIGPRFDRIDVLIGGFRSWLSNHAIVSSAILDGHAAYPERVTGFIVAASFLAAMLILVVDRALCCLPRLRRSLSRSIVLLAITIPLFYACLFVRLDASTAPEPILRYGVTGNRLEAAQLRIRSGGMLWGENIWRSLPETGERFRLPPDISFNRLRLIMAYPSEVSSETSPVHAGVTWPDSGGRPLTCTAIQVIDPVEVRRSIGFQDEGIRIGVLDFSLPDAASSGAGADLELLPTDQVAGIGPIRLISIGYR